MLVTNKGKAHFLSKARGVAAPTNYYVALCTDANVPTLDTNVLSDLTEIAAGNGYTTGGYELDPNATDFDVLTEDDVNDRGLIQIKDLVFTAGGGPIPSSGDGARYAVLTDDDGTVADREVYAAWDLTSARSLLSGESLTLQNLEIRAVEP